MLMVFNNVNCREHCGLSFVLLDNYRDHCKQKHDGELRLLNCDRCNDVFTLQSHLEAHKESIHKEVSYDLSIFEDLEQEELSCPFCNEKFETVSMMRVYLPSVWNDMKTPIRIGLFQRVTLSPADKKFTKLKCQIHLSDWGSANLNFSPGALAGECDESPPGGEAPPTLDLPRLWGGAALPQADQVGGDLLLIDVSLFNDAGITSSTAS